MNKEDKEKFLSKLSTTDPNKCWEWTGFRTWQGYGKFVFGKEQLAHRISWILHNGDIPKGMLVCHKCDNPPCCNPAHLFPGTVRDNNDDRDRKGRGVVPDTRGSHHGMAKLTEKDVALILKLHKEGRSNKERLKIVTISPQIVSQIIHRRIWRHVEIPS